MTIQTLEAYASQALSCSQQMYLLAEQQDWDGLSRLESDRMLILEAMFNHPCLPMFLGKIADTLGYIIEIDQKTMARGKLACRALSREMELLNREHIA